MFDVNPSLIRYWEKEFDFIKPRKTTKGSRRYTIRDIERIRLVYNLVKERGLTLQGARKKIRENKKELDQNYEVIRRLQEIRNLLLRMQEEI